MKDSRDKPLVLLLLVLVCLASMAAGLRAQGGAPAWPHWLGPTQNGVAVDPGAFAGRSSVRLAKAWSRPLETGHAGLAVADGRVFTLFSDGIHDYAVALRTDTGAEAWRVRLDASVERTFLPGPTSTPAFHAGRLFTLSSACRLRAHDAASGRTQWEIDLKEKFGTKAPMGCGSSAFVEGGRLFLQTAGGEDHRIVALDPARGDLVWASKGSDPAPYGAPVAADVAGLRQMLVHHTSAGQRGGVTGIRLSDGAVLWSTTLPQGFSFDTPLALPGDRILLSTFNDVHLLRVTREDETWRAAPSWRSADLQAAVSPPVFHAGYLFGFGGDHLACVDVETGVTLWKEKTYPGSLILVDGHLVTLSTSAGLMRVVEASASGYREKARLQVLNRGAQTWTPPSYAGRRIFVRNEEEIAAVDLRSE